MAAAADDPGLIPLCVPHLEGNEWAYVKECLDTNFVSSVGPFVERFERELAARVGARYAVATVNGTAALHIALDVAGVQSDDEVLVSTLSFIAPANAIRYARAWPVFIDADATYWEMDPQRVVDFLERDCRWADGELRNRTTGRRVSAILPVHILGHPVDLNPILTVARKYDLRVIEDATESLGATYDHRAAGTIGHIGCFSFNGNKLITTGGGGMIVTDDEQLARRARYLTTQAKDDALEFVHGAIGYNYRLTNIAAALGCAQLERLDAYVAKKRAIATRYAETLSEIEGVAFMAEAPWAFSSFWLSTILVDERAFGMDRRALCTQLQRAGIQTRPLWQPLHRSPAHAYSTSSCPVAERIQSQALSLPSSVGLSSADQDRVVAVLGGLRSSRSGA